MKKVSVFLVLIAALFASGRNAQAAAGPAYQCSNFMAVIAAGGIEMTKTDLLQKQFKNNGVFANWIISRGYNASDAVQMAQPPLADEEGSTNQYYNLVKEFHGAKPDASQVIDPKTVNLKKDAQELGYHIKYKLDTIDPYEILVANLRKGDTVIMSDKTFLLGDFLGYGNATHIFRNANDPTRAIRIPFLAGKRLRALHVAKEYVMNTLDNQPVEKVGRVQILNVGEDFDYIEVNYIDGVETGANYIQNQNFIALKQWESIFTNPKISDNEKNRQIDELERVALYQAEQIQDPLEKDRAIKLIAAFRRFPLQHPGQFLWDRTNLDWILMDWEKTQDHPVKDDEFWGSD